MPEGVCEGDGIPFTGNRAGVKVRAAARTHPGRAKPNNEDACAVFIDQQFFLVADGMGGMNGGEVAAAMTVERIPPLVLPHLAGGDPLELIGSAMSKVSRDIWQQSATSRSLYGMGSTVVAVHVRGEELFVAHAGDARVYLWRGGELRLLTDDHTLVHALFKQGTITAEQAEVHPWRSQLIRHMGQKKLEFETQTVPVEPGDRVLLCSDGLNKELPDLLIGQLLGAAANPEQAVEVLVEQANERGGRDNITALVVFLEA